MENRKSQENLEISKKSSQRLIKLAEILPKNLFLHHRKPGNFSLNLAATIIKGYKETTVIGKRASITTHTGAKIPTMT